MAHIVRHVGRPGGLVHRAEASRPGGCRFKFQSIEFLWGGFPLFVDYMKQVKPKWYRIEFTLNISIQFRSFPLNDPPLTSYWRLCLWLELLFIQARSRLLRTAWCIVWQCTFSTCSISPLQSWLMKYLKEINSNPVTFIALAGGAYGRHPSTKEIQEIPGFAQNWRENSCRLCTGNRQR